MRHILTAALLITAATAAAATGDPETAIPVTPPPAKDAPAAKPPAPKAKEAPASSAAAEAAPSEAAATDPAAVADTAAAAQAQSEEERRRAEEARAAAALAPTPPEYLELVSGAPLRDPNVAVHIVQRKRFAERGRHELVLYPVAPQLNGLFTQHVGSALSYVYHVHENFGFQVAGQYNWFNDDSSFNRELLLKLREEAPPATSLLLQWGAQAGVEVTPVYGKFAFYQGTLAQFTLVLSGGAGVGSTRHQLRPNVSKCDASGCRTLPPTFGDTGMKLLGSLGGGLRMQIGDRFAFRLEVRDLVYTARVDRVNGCDAGDLGAMNDLVQTPDKTLAGRVHVGAGCQVEKFDGTDSRTGEPRWLDVPLSKSLVDQPTSDVLNNLSLYTGFSILF